jgi:protein-L-isoaspartate(D-aspartate) O-methyltransferase
MTDLTAQRRFFAEEMQVVSNIASAAVVEALASVPREQFLSPGPWMIRGEADFQQPPRHTIDADPRHLYHNVAVAIDADRMLFNGAPGLIGMAIDRLGLGRGDRVLHLGAGTGYYTAVMGHCVGADGRVFAIEVDEALATTARANLSSMPWVDVRHGNGTEPMPDRLDAMLVNAGVTHPRDEWLDALTIGGRMVLSLTATAPRMGTIGKGYLLLLTKSRDGSFDVRAIGFVAIYSAIGVRDEALNVALGDAMRRSGPMMPARTLRRDPHERTDACWLHGPTVCFC